MTAERNSTADLQELFARSATVLIEPTGNDVQPAVELPNALPTRFVRVEAAIAVAGLVERTIAASSRTANRFAVADKLAVELELD